MGSSRRKTCSFYVGVHKSEHFPHGGAGKMP
jgi:hypothetical protein